MTYNFGGVSSAATGEDDPTNASGLGAPAIIRGTVYGHLAAGVTVGAGQSGTVQTATGVALQAAITYAEANGKIFELVPNTYEINNAAGLVIPPTEGFVWRGSRGGTLIRQFYVTSTGAPIMTVGSTTGGSGFNGFDVQGMHLQYGASQTGLTSSTALLIGNGAGSRIGSINISVGGGSPGYDGWSLVCPSGGNFSNTYFDIQCSQAQRHLFNFNAAGGSTGNVFSNIYMSAGFLSQFPTPTAISGNMICFSQGCADMLFDRLNLEWTSCSTAISAPSFQLQGTVFNALHVEGVTLTGYSPHFFNLANASIQINGFDLSICIQSAQATGSPCLILDYPYGASTVQINNMNMGTLASGSQTMPFYLATFSSSGLGDSLSMIEVNNLAIEDSFATPINTVGQWASNFQFDSHLPLANFATPNRVGHYEYNAKGSKLERALLRITSTYTHYGSSEDATIAVPAIITSFTLTLSNLQAATGNQPVRTGCTVHVRRDYYTPPASGTLTIVDDAGTTLATSTVHATDYFFIFNGTHYVSFTPVTT